MSTKFTSMARQSRAIINGIDFKAIQSFESKHPDLFTKSATPLHTDWTKNAGEQMNAFNALFNHPVYGEEFKKLIQELRN